MAGPPAANRVAALVQSLLANQYLVLGSRLVLGMLFLVASIEKIADPDAFAVSIGNYKLLPADVSLLISSFLPWVELLCALGLLFGIAVRGSALLTGLMLAAFTIAVATALMRGLDISCGCFTQDPAVGRIGMRKIVENITMIFVAVFILSSRRDRFTLESHYSDSSSQGS